MTRRRKTILIILSVFAVLIVIFSIKMYLFFTAKPNIAVNYVAEWNRISKPENYDPNLNAFFDYYRATDYFVEQPEIIYSYPKWPGDMNDSEMKILKDWLDENSKALEYFKTGSKKPYYWEEFPEHVTETWEIKLPLLSSMRTYGHASCWQAKMNAYENNIDSALEDLIICYRSGILMTGNNRTIIEQLVGTSLRELSINTGFSILSNTRIDSEKLADFQRQLENAMAEEPMTIDFTGEKFFIYDIIQRIFTDDGKGNGHLIPSEATKILEPFSFAGQSQPRSFLEIIGNLFSGKSSGNNEYNLNFLEIALNGPDRKHHIETVEKVYKFYDDIQAKSLWEIHNKSVNPQRQMDDMVADYSILKIFVPAFYRVIELNHRQKTEASALLTTIGILRYEAKKGNLPESLSELLSAGYIKELPMDPYNDGPLVYIKTENGFLLCSFGADFDDDGGTHSAWGRDGGDQVFWPVEKDEN